MNFKEIEGFPNYLIYEDGRVWSKIGKGRWLKVCKYSNGYLQVLLPNGKKKKHLLIHRLLAIHFISNPHNKPCVDHKDGDITNNKLLNLRWVTKRQNSLNRVNAIGVTYIEKCKLNHWRASWYEKGKRKSKSFPTEDEALKHRKLMVAKYYERPN